MAHPLSAKKRILISTVTLALAFSLAQSGRAEDVSNTIANGATSAVGAVSQGLGAFSSSQQQMQMLVNQTSMLNQLQGNAQNAPQMAALNQMKMNLAMAVSKAQMCVNNAKKDLTKYKKATINGKNLETAEATCETYGNMIDSLRKNADQINEANTEIACVKNLQNEVNQIAETAKAPFKQLTEAAAKVWNTRDKIIKIHHNIAEQITRDVDGKGGFREQLGKLQKLALDMNAKVAEYGDEVKSIQEDRVNLANQWYYDILGQVQSCYENKRQPCFNGTAMSASACVANYIGATSKDNPVSRAQAGKNVQISESMNAITAGRMQDVAQPIQGDVKDPAGFLKIMDSKFNEVVNESAQEIQGTEFVGNGVSPSQISAFMKARYNACYASTKANFTAQMNSEGNKYKASLKSITTRENSAALKAKNLILQAKNQMTDFKTAFTKTYNRDLSMFSASCTAGNDPYESVDCLRKMQGMLNSGINGHPETVKLNNGSSITIDAGTTAISIPNLQLDAQGQPSNGNGQTTCAGFQECIVVMSNARDSHEKAEQSETLNQEKFVEQSNSDISNVMSGIATSFTTMSQMITAGVTSLNQDLVAAGVSTTIETKEAKSEELEKDDKTGLYKTPKSMKAAFAGAGSYSEMGDTSDAASAINERKTILAKKFAEAAKMKSACDVKKSDYASVANAIGDCSSKNLCKTSNISKMMMPLESLFHKSGVKPKENEKNAVQQAYDRCMKSAKSAEPDDKDDEEELDAASIALLPAADRPDAIRNRSKQKADKKSAKKDAVKDERGSCAEAAASQLTSIASESRGSLRTKNNDIATAIGKISTACSGDEDDQSEAVTYCEQAKSLLTSYTPPTTDAETTISTTGGGSSSTITNTIRGAQ